MSPTRGSVACRPAARADDPRGLKRLAVQVALAQDGAGIGHAGAYSQEVWSAYSPQSLLLLPVPIRVARQYEGLETH